MKKQVFNPYLPEWEYVPDGEPHVFENRLYIYGSHDFFNGKTFCMGDYVGWSAPMNDLSDWRYEGVIYKKEQDPRNSNGEHYLYAPDVAEYHGKYYLFYCLDTLPEIGVAVSDTPCGEYCFLGLIRHPDGKILGSGNDMIQFDPGVLVDGEDIYLYSGNAPIIKGTQTNQYSQVMQLCSDMLTLKTVPVKLIPSVDDSDGTGFEGHEFFEASSPRKIGNRYYLVYSSVKSHELCYAVSDYPDHDFHFGGTLIDIGDVGLYGRTEEQALNALGNTHGGLVKIGEQWYIFYHRQTNRSQFSRQGCAEPIIFENGKFKQAEVTSCGLNVGPLKGNGTYPAWIACNLVGENNANYYQLTEEIAKSLLDNESFSFIGEIVEKTRELPYFTQDEADGMSSTQYIANLRNGAAAGFKYFYLNGNVSVCVYTRGTGAGRIIVTDSLDGEQVAEIEISPSKEWIQSRYVTLLSKKKLLHYISVFTEQVQSI